MAGGDGRHINHASAFHVRLELMIVWLSNVSNDQPAMNHRRLTWTYITSHSRVIYAAVLRIIPCRVNPNEGRHIQRHLARKWPLTPEAVCRQRSTPSLAGPQSRKAYGGEPRIYARLSTDAIKRRGCRTSPKHMRPGGLVVTAIHTCTNVCAYVYLTRGEREESRTPLARQERTSI